MKYRKRLVEDLFITKLKSKGCVVVEGLKWCGKTTTAKQFAKSILEVDDPKNKNLYKEISNNDPSLLLNGKTPRLIDEWQLIPKLWDCTRHEIDNRQKEGQFIFTGSSTPIDSNEITHSGAGRFTWLKMRTMSLFESGESNGSISLSELFNKPLSIFGNNNLKINDLAYLICRGGWPHSLNVDKDTALLDSFDYIDAVINSDISRVDNITRNPERAKNILKSLARNQGGRIINTTIKNDIVNNDNLNISEDTIYSYVNAFKKIYLIENSCAWNPNLRSKTAIRTSDTLYFTDPSIAVALLGLGPNDLLNDFSTFGLLFETLCIRDLRIYLDRINGEVYHYRDKNGLECDAVCHLRNGTYALIEIKLGGDKAIDLAATNLKKLASKIDTNKMKEPAFLMVLTGSTEYAYRRNDGVYVVPIGCLKN